MLFTVCLATLLALTWNKKVRVGTYVVATAVTYGPVRFAMDYLRITEGMNADPRYAAASPQPSGAALALTLFGVSMAVLMTRHRARGFDPSLLVLAGSDSGEEVAKKKALAAPPPAEPEEDEDDEDEPEEKPES